MKLTTKDKNLPHGWLPKLPFPRPAVDTDTKEKRTIEQLQEENRQLKTAVRWSVGFIVNVALGLEITDGAKVELAHIKQGIKEGLKKNNVPRGSLVDLKDVPIVLKEWDFRTFRVEQDIEVVESTEDRIVLRHSTCPEMFKTMRRSAQFLIERVNMEHYLYLPTPLDFLCVPHSLCRSVLISWLSDGKFEVEELRCERNSSCDGICTFAVKRVQAPVRRTSDPPKA